MAAVSPSQAQKRYLIIEIIYRASQNASCFMTSCRYLLSRSVKSLTYLKKSNSKLTTTKYQHISRIVSRHGELTKPCRTCIYPPMHKIQQTFKRNLNIGIPKQKQRRNNRKPMEHHVHVIYFEQYD
jgi:hypothetical protein